LLARASAGEATFDRSTFSIRASEKPTERDFYEKRSALPLKYFISRDTIIDRVFPPEGGRVSIPAAAAANPISGATAVLEIR